MKLSRLLVALLAALACLSTITFLVPGPLATAQTERADESLSIFQVTVDDDADIDALVASGVDLLEARGDGYLLVIGDSDTAAALRSDGFVVVEQRRLDPLQGVGHNHDDATHATYFGGYRTFDEHVRDLRAAEENFPELATVIDYGDSWRALNDHPDGNDLLAICLTNRQAGDCALQPDSPKPRAVIIAAIHARELQTSEVASRLIDELTQGYGVDPEITYAMDTTEVWVIPVANPDGREIVEAGGNNPYLQRKNANDTAGNCAQPAQNANHHGVDLNRNASYRWGGVGTTSNPCGPIYPGTSAASEPEQQALEALFTQLWPDQNSSPASPVAPTATGTFITLHSYSDLILFPPGTDGVTPNDRELRTLAFRMSHFNGYYTGTGPEILYGASGTTDDWTYGELGVASFTYELGPLGGPCGGFTPPFSCTDSIWAANRDALLYSIKVAGAPYQTPLGPTTLDVSVPAFVVPDDIVTATAAVQDDALGQGIARPTPSPITEVEYYVDRGPDQGGSPLPMVAIDGLFDSADERAAADLSTSGLELGEHLLLVRGRNSGDHWGPLSVANFVVRPEGASTQTCDGEFATIDLALNGGDGEGTSGDDVIVGTDEADVINGRGGNDLICAGQGDDLVTGGQGNDIIFGGAGNDRLLGSPGRDQIFGEDGNDVLHGNLGDDVISGGDGDDRMFGYGGNDVLNGNEGDDRLHGNFGSDTINGGIGNDALFGYGDDDAMGGGDGDDLLVGNFGDDSLIGGAGSDILWGADGADVVIGGPDADVVNGNSGNDQLDGGEGNDTLDGGIGTDSCHGGPQVDTALRCETVTSVP